MLPALLPAPALRAVCSFLKEMSSIEIPPSKSSRRPPSTLRQLQQKRSFCPALPTAHSHFFSISTLRRPFLLYLTPQNNRHRPEIALFPHHYATFLPLWYSHF